MKEVCEVLGVKKATVYRQIMAKEIPSVRVGKLYLVPRAWLERIRKKAG